MKFEIVKSDKKVELVKELINRLDDLYDDLTYDNDEKETECIKAKIKMREDMLKQLGGVSNASFDEVKYIDALFAEYNKSYKTIKEGQVFPQWLNDEQLKWVLTVAKNCC